MAGYRSALEGRVADLLEHHRVNYEYETVQLPYVLECKYKPDFILPNGIYLEVKGYLDADDKRKMVAVKKAHPELDIRFVFQGPFKTIPRTKMTHAQWAEKHGFPWCHYQNIPLSWLKSPSTSTTTTAVESPIN
jgi:hypothetical protein